MADRELKLNSISRFSKQSPHLVLEEHGACEVPAGCGGVILRWRGSHDPVPVKLWLFARGEHQLFMDGEALTSGRPLIAPGEHVLAGRLDRSPNGELVLLVAGTADHEPYNLRVTPGTTPAASLSLLSLPDGSWRYTTVEPPDDAWMRPGYDDDTWPAMIQQKLPEPTPQSMDDYWIRQLQERGAQPPGIEGQANAVWLRKTFALTTREAP